MLFNCDGGMKTYSLGAWSGQKVNDSGVSTKDLFNWLTKEKTLSGSSKPLTPGLIKRGFSDSELDESNDGSTVATAIAKIIKHDSAKALQNALSYLLFSCPWDPSLLGHAICFLYKFCEKVSQGPERFLQDPYKEHSEAFKDVCKGLQSSLQPFIFGSSYLFAVCHGNQNLFNDLWDETKFEAYCTWLKENLHSVINALQTMPMESSQWSSNHLMSGFSAGPFKYGFVYKASWTSGSTSMSKLQGYISKLTGEDSGSLGKLKSFLENPSTPSSAAATAAGAAGGIFGLGGAGAGVAYATNAFGFQNFISGLISSFLK
ncbi:hypothetical protein X943_003947 [Babesia divergens]|uniref:Uncharacterized protein n=1 Tax=Babesia divergens TaxID=32595 RepID=A0AAD9G5H3_BABDI|nr:hypothetical protein X943_003947 [Babesia divergens]